MEGNGISRKDEALKLVKYTLFGTTASVMNALIYSFLFEGCGLWNAASVIIAWLLSNSFAFLTEKLFAFHSSFAGFRKCVAELMKFYSSRLMTGILDILAMEAWIRTVALYPGMAKFIVNIFLGVINYMICRFMIFGDSKRR